MCTCVPTRAGDAGNVRGQRTCGHRCPRPIGADAYPAGEQPRLVGAPQGALGPDGWAELPDPILPVVIENPDSQDTLEAGAEAGEWGQHPEPTDRDSIVLVKPLGQPI